MTETWRKRLNAALIYLLGGAFGTNLGPDRICLGDRIFQALGLEPWSDGGRLGLHYPAVIGVVLICVGARMYQSTLEERERIWVWVYASMLLWAVSKIILWIL